MSLVWGVSSPSDAVILRMVPVFSDSLVLRVSSIQPLMTNDARNEAATIMFLAIVFIALYSNKSSRSVPGSNPGALLPLKMHCSVSIEMIEISGQE